MIRNDPLTLVVKQKSKNLSRFYWRKIHSLFPTVWLHKLTVTTEIKISEIYKKREVIKSSMPLLKTHLQQEL